MTELVNSLKKVKCLCKDSCFNVEKYRLFKIREKQNKTKNLQTTCKLYFGTRKPLLNKGLQNCDY